MGSTSSDTADLQDESVLLDELERIAEGLDGQVSTIVTQAFLRGCCQYMGLLLLLRFAPFVPLFN